jgi:hypothetical protein
MSSASQVYFAKVQNLQVSAQPTSVLSHTTMASAHRTSASPNKSLSFATPQRFKLTATKGNLTYETVENPAPGQTYFNAP